MPILRNAYWANSTGSPYIMGLAKTVKKLHASKEAGLTPPPPPVYRAGMLLPSADEVTWPALSLP